MFNSQQHTRVTAILNKGGTGLRMNDCMFVCFKGRIKLPLPDESNPYSKGFVCHLSNSKKEDEDFDHHLV